MTVAARAATWRARDPLHPGRRRLRRRPATREGAQGRRGRGAPVRVLPDPLLGPLPGAARACAILVADAPADDAAPLGAAEDLTGPTGAALPGARVRHRARRTARVVTTWRRNRSVRAGRRPRASSTGRTRERRTLTDGHRAGTAHPAFSPDGRTVAVARGDRRLAPRSPTLEPRGSSTSRQRRGARRRRAGSTAGRSRRSGRRTAARSVHRRRPRRRLDLPGRPRRTDGSRG